jgi:hypothetical protein
VIDYIEENGDMCLHIKTDHNNSEGIGYCIVDSLPLSLKSNLVSILNNTLTTDMKVKRMKLNDSLNFDVGWDATGRMNVNLQLLMKSGRVRGDSAFKYWKFCIHKKTQ